MTWIPYEAFVSQDEVGDEDIGAETSSIDPKA